MIWGSYKVYKSVSNRGGVSFRGGWLYTPLFTEHHVVSMPATVCTRPPNKFSWTSLEGRTVDNYLRLRSSNGLPDIRDSDDPAEEKIRLMQDVKRLDEDVLDGLIRGLKIPAPSLNNPSAVKEILFPANLISLVTNEMWKYGLIPESERFLANVMQTIQAHVMVCGCSCFSVSYIWSFW